MKKSLKLVVGVILCLSMLLSFVSCQYVDAFISRYREKDIVQNNSESDDKKTSQNVHTVPDGTNEKFPGVPDGYTGGFMLSQQFHSDTKITWLETYDELCEVVTLLKSHGSNVHQVQVFNCEEYGLDIKFCLMTPRSADKTLKEGENYFDRKLGVEITSFVFFEDVTIEELEYGFCYSYDCIEYGGRSYKADDPRYADDIEIYREEFYQDRKLYYVYYNGEVQFTFHALGSSDFIISEEQIEILKKTLEVI